MVRIQPVLTNVETDLQTLRIAQISLRGVPRGAAVVVAESGQLDIGSVDVMNALAERGYESVLLFLDQAPAADGWTADRLGDIVVRLARYLGKCGWIFEQVGLIGYGLGARAVLSAAATGVYGAAVSLSPGKHISLPELRAPVQTPWLGLFADLGAARAEIGLAAESQKLRSPVHVEAVEYRGVAADFYRFPTTPVAHAAAFDAWQRTIEWLNLRVVPRTAAPPVVSSRSSGTENLS